MDRFFRLYLDLSPAPDEDTTTGLELGPASIPRDVAE
jgi:hypothetical protein